MRPAAAASMAPRSEVSSQGWATMVTAGVPSRAAAIRRSYFESAVSGHGQDAFRPDASRASVTSSGPRPKSAATRCRRSAGASPGAPLASMTLAERGEGRRGAPRPLGQQRRGSRASAASSSIEEHQVLVADQRLEVGERHLPAGGVGTQFDAASGSPTAQITLPAPGAGVALAGGAVWVTSPYAGKLFRIDPVTNSVVATVPIGGVPRFLATGEGALWILDARGGVRRVNPTSGALTASNSAGAISIARRRHRGRRRLCLGLCLGGAGHADRPRERSAAGELRGRRPVRRCPALRRRLALDTRARRSSASERRKRPEPGRITAPFSPYPNMAQWSRSTTGARSSACRPVFLEMAARNAVPAYESDLEDGCGVMLLVTAAGFEALGTEPG